MDGDLLLIFWMYGIPILFAVTVIFVVIFWIFVVPKPSKEILKAKLTNSPLLDIVDDAGNRYINRCSKILPKIGIFHPKFSWKLLPQRVREPKSEEEALIYDVATKRTILYGAGVPMYTACSIKVTSLPPPLLAGYEGSVERLLKSKHGENPKGWWDETEEKIARLVYINPTTIAQIVGDMFPSTAFETIRYEAEMMGMQRSGRDYAKLALSGGIILAILILGIVALSYIFR